MNFSNKNNDISKFLWKYKSLKGKTRLLVLLSVSLPFLGNAQSIEKFSINSGGASTSASGIEILYTIGEVNIAEHTSTSVSISEGFINGDVSSALGVDDLEILANKITIYPNPTSGNINISTEVELTKMELYDVLGKKVLKSSYVNKLNVESLKSGIYFLRLYNNKSMDIKRVVIK